MLHTCTFLLHLTVFNATAAMLQCSNDAAAMMMMTMTMALIEQMLAHPKILFDIFHFANGAVSQLTNALSDKSLVGIFILPSKDSISSPPLLYI